MNIERKKILVTGGAGFIGSHVTERLLERGGDVYAVDNFFSGHESLVPSDATVEEVDIYEEGVGSIVHYIDPDAIVHLAAIHYIPYCNEFPEEAFQVNVMGTRNVVRAARELESLEGFVYASSAAVYPPRDEPHREDAAVGPMDIYGETKLVGEDLMRQFAADTGVPTASARLFNVYGPRETNPHLIPAIIEQIDGGQRTIELGNLSPKRDFVHVDDVARALCGLLAEFDQQYETFNVGTGVEYSVREVVENVSTALGEKLDVEQDSERVRESDRPHLVADVSKIEEEIGWTPHTSFVDGLRELLDQEVTA